MCDDLLEDLRRRIDPGRAANSARFFKTAPGEYGAGDEFWGIRVPDQRDVVKIWARKTGPAEWDFLTAHRVHEVRLTGWLCVVRVHDKEPQRRAQALDFTLKHLDRMNNWDLVDSTAPFVLGPEIHKTGDLTLLETWAASPNLWIQRIAVMATFYAVRHGRFDLTLAIADRLKDHPHDLVHKAVGWMLREVGNRNPEVEIQWLQTRYKTLPRTLLRYAIEKFPESQRKKYLSGHI